MNLLFYIWTAFTLSEVGLLVSKRSKKGAVKDNNDDKKSLLLLWIIIAGSLTFGGMVTAYNNWHFSFSTTIAGDVVAIIGFAIRWTAIMQLGKMFTVDVSISTMHILKTEGLYKVVRHPSYLGLILIIAGIALCLNKIASLLIMVIPIFVAINYRIRVEEKALVNEFGDQYLQYKSRVARIIPWIY
jgi:protein-S-isoprenylcysteine O-methyltransferase Ste14